MSVQFDPERLTLALAHLHQRDATLFKQIKDDRARPFDHRLDRFLNQDAGKLEQTREIDPEVIPRQDPHGNCLFEIREDPTEDLLVHHRSLRRHAEIGANARGDAAPGESSRQQ